MSHSFESLGRLKYGEASRLVAAGKPVDAASLVGWEFRGWNLFPHPIAKGIGMLFDAGRFAKGFFRFPGETDIYGYNIDIVPGGLTEEWKERMVNGAPNRRRFFHVHAANEGANRGGRFPQSLFFDYAEGRPKSGYFDGGGLRDYFVQVDESNPDLFILMAYQMIGPLWSAGGIGVVERWRKYDYVPTVKAA